MTVLRHSTVFFFGIKFPLGELLKGNLVWRLATNDYDAVPAFVAEKVARLVESPFHTFLMYSRICVSDLVRCVLSGSWSPARRIDSSSDSSSD